MTDTLRENLGKALERELRELLRTKEAPYMDLAEACQSAARAALAAAPQPTPDPLRETDVPHMHPMEVMARNFRAKLRAALAAPQPAPDPLREAAQAVLDCWDSRNWKAAPTADYMRRLRAALAAAPQPAPAAADERAEIERIICDAFTCDLRGRGDEDGAFWQTAADALLARGLRLPEDGETLAWAVIEDGIISPNLIDSEKESVQRWAEAWKGSMVRVAIRVVEGCDDAA